MIEFIYNPGTTVMFSGSTSGFDVDGKFWAVGTQTDSILFSSLFKIHQVLLITDFTFWKILLIQLVLSVMQE